MRLMLRWISSALLPCLLAGPVVDASTLIVNARLTDGAGLPAREAAVRIEGERIKAVGDLAPAPGEEIVDGQGLVLAPGFIDTHSHYLDSFGAGGDDLMKRPEALPAVSQGITTIVVGADGSSGLPLAETFSQLERVRTAINVASFVGHGSIRFQVMGDDFRRKATSREQQAMRGLVDGAMKEGALGLSTGLEYNPGIYATREEVLALAQEAARHGGRYMSHVRSEDRALWEALDEVIEIGRRTKRPVHVSHMKLGMKDLWGQVDRFISKLESARAQGIEITGDVYPYDFWETTLTALFPQRDFGNVEAARFVLEHIVAATDIRFTLYERDRSLVGKTLAEIAAARDEDPAITMTKLIVDVPTPEDYELATMVGMSATDVEGLLLWPHANICTDGALVDGHPRAAGAFTKVLREYVRERTLLTLEEAVRKMTSLAARHMGLQDRGLVRPGYFADLVLFDPATVSDRSTTLEPQRLSVGVVKVWVNGGLVYAGGAPTGTRPGKVLRR